MNSHSPENRAHPTRPAAGAGRAKEVTGSRRRRTHKGGANIEMVCAYRMPYVHALYVCLLCMPSMYALYVCLICMPYMRVSCISHALCACLISMPYMYALYRVSLCTSYSNLLRPSTLHPGGGRVRSDRMKGGDGGAGGGGGEGGGGGGGVCVRPLGGPAQKSLYSNYY